LSWGKKNTPRGSVLLLVKNQRAFVGIRYYYVLNYRCGGASLTFTKTFFYNIYEVQYTMQ